MKTRERVVRTIRGDKVDKVPIYAPYTTGQVINPAGIPVSLLVAYLLMDGVPALDKWMTKDPNYLDIVKLAEEKCEKVWTYGFPEFDRRFLLVPRECIKVAEVEEQNTSLLTRYQIRTPKGSLEYICEKQKDISTVWDRKPLIEDEKDVEKILSVPYTLYFSETGC